MKLHDKVIVTMKKYDFWKLNHETTYCVPGEKEVVLVKRINGKLRCKLENATQWHRIYKSFTELEDTTFYKYSDYLKRKNVYDHKQHITFVKQESEEN